MEPKEAVFPLDACYVELVIYRWRSKETTKLHLAVDLEPIQAQVASSSQAGDDSELSAGRDALTPYVQDLVKHHMTHGVVECIGCGADLPEAMRVLKIESFTAGPPAMFLRRHLFTGCTTGGYNSSCMKVAKKLQNWAEKWEADNRHNQCLQPKYHCGGNCETYTTDARRDFLQKMFQLQADLLLLGGMSAPPLAKAQT